MTKTITIDGQRGEGGGQIIRTSLSLSMVTGQPFLIENIRAGRKKSGLMRQHLTCVRAAAEVCSAEVTGDTLGSDQLVFEPGAVKPGDYHFATGSAGSSTLVAQTVLPALLLGGNTSSLKLEGGTHNMAAPPYDFIAECYLPLLRRMGVQVESNLIRRGFYPVGGGEWTLNIMPCAVKNLKPLELMRRIGETIVTAEAITSRIDHTVGNREVGVVRKNLELNDDAINTVVDNRSKGPGNVLMVRAASDNVTEIATGFGKVGVRAETVAKNAAKQMKRYVISDAAVGPYLADQLLLPMALGTGGRFTMLRPSKHTLTNINVINAFLPDVKIEISEGASGVWTVEVG